MKFKTTQKAIKNAYTNIICVGYCELQNLLAYQKELAYTTRREGWAADIYEISNNTVIVTGYSTFGNINPEYELLLKYDKKAEKIRRNYDIELEERKQQVNNLLNEFIKEVFKNDN